MSDLPQSLVQALATPAARSILETIVTAVVAFTTTNVDGLLLVILLFASLNGHPRAHQIVIGIYLGFTVLIGISLIGFVGAQLVPREWIGVLGLVPIYLGVRGLMAQRSEVESETEMLAVAAEPPRSVLALAIAGFLSPETYRVAALTIGNGGDNVSVYIPLFASVALDHLALTIAVFFVMLALWCYIGHALANSSATSRLIERWGERLVPYIFLALGCWILARQGTLALALRAIGVL